MPVIEVGKKYIRRDGGGPVCPHLTHSNAVGYHFGDDEVWVWSGTGDISTSFECPGDLVSEWTEEAERPEGRADGRNGPVSQEVLDAYAPLYEVMSDAWRQAALGKGAERHADQCAFVDQPNMQVARMTGPGGPAFQAMKKIREAVRMHQGGDGARAEAELLGAIVYSAMAILVIREGK